MKIAAQMALSLALVVTAASGAVAQSQPNFGPHAPSRGDSFGKPPSGAQAPMSGARAYAYRSHSYQALRLHHHYRRHHHHHMW